MTSATSSIKTLHQLLKQIEAARDGLNKGPRLLKAKNNLVVQKEQQLAEFQQEIKQLKLATDRKQLDLRTLEKKLEDLQGKLNTASSNREFDIIKGQIEADRVAKSVLEDEVLELLEKTDEAAGHLPSLQEAVKDAQLEVTRYDQEFSQTKIELESRIQQLEVELQAAEKLLQPETREKYNRLVSSRGAAALATATNHACDNCFVQILPQQRILIKTQQFIFCSNCGSVLYLDD